MAWVTVVPGGDYDLRFGYTLDDLNRFAHLAVRRLGPMAADWQDRVEAAWSAIAEHLYAAQYPPPEHDFVDVGMRAVRQIAYDDMKHHGAAPHAAASGLRWAGSRPAFQRYWDGVGTSPSPERTVVERHAVRQIWPRLAPAQRRALLALAAHGDYRAAAAGAGLTYYSLCSAVRLARQQFLGYWHEGETPRALWRDRRRWRQDTAPAEVRRSATVRHRAAVRRRDRDQVRNARRREGSVTSGA